MTFRIRSTPALNSILVKSLSATKLATAASNRDIVSDSSVHESQAIFFGVNDVDHNVSLTAKIGGDVPEFGFVPCAAFSYAPYAPFPPANWSLIYPTESQSPINIDTGDFPFSSLSVNYDTTINFDSIENDGHTLKVNVPSGYFLTASGVQYPLVQFHFHRPSEHTVDGDSFSGEIHFVHVLDDTIVVLAVLIIALGGDNAAMTKFLDTAPQIDGVYLIGESAAGNVNLSSLIPNTMDAKAYVGSLTTPPCTTGVQWYVLETEVNISTAQDATFGRLLVQTSIDRYQYNSRPIQN